MQSNTPNWLEQLHINSEIFPHQLDLIQDKVLLINLPDKDRNEASFLDQRVFNQNTKGMWVDWQKLKESSKKITPHPNKKSHFIFHVGHCGSTLLSRLLAFENNIQSIREPLILRTLAQDLTDSKEGRSFLDDAQRLERLKHMESLWSRDAERTVVKATSICTDLMPNILRQHNKSKAIFIYNNISTHLATLLAGENSLIDLKSFAHIRVQRVRQSTGLKISLNDLSVGQLAVLSWLSETCSAQLAMDECTDKIKLLNFETLLAKPIDTLSACLQFFSLIQDGEDDLAKQAVASPIMSSYSKAPEYKYDANTRRTLIENAYDQHRQEIQRSLEWLNHLANQSELITKVQSTFK